MDSRRLDACLTKGQQVLAKTGDRSLANVLFTECVHGDPSQLPYVEAFLDNLASSERSKRHPMIFSRSLAIRLAAWREDWTAVIQHGTHRLTVNPWHVPTLLTLASACQSLHFNEVELRYLKQALDADSHSEKVNMRCALSLARMGQFDQAMACWKRLEDSKRFTATAREKIYQLAIDKANAVRHPPEEAESIDARREAGVDEDDSESEGAATDEILATRDEELDWDAYKPPTSLNRSESADGKAVTNHDWKRGFAYRPGFLEVALVLVAASLVVQLSPGLQTLLWENIRIAAFLANLVVVLGLIAYRQMQQNQS